MLKHKRKKIAQSSSRRHLRTLKRVIFIVVIIVAVAAIGYQALASTSSSTALAGWVGREAPDFTLPKVNGGAFSLKSYGKSNVLLFFNEGLMCSPCIKQMVDLNNDYRRFEALNVVLVAITTDSRSDLAEWARINKITNLIVLSDEDLQVSTTYKMLGPDVSMMPGMGPGHSFVLVDTSGIIRSRADYGPGIMYVKQDEIFANVKKILSG